MICPRARKSLIDYIKTENPMPGSPNGGSGKPNIRELERNRNVEGLVEALRHEDEGVREYAAEALGNLGDRTGVDPLCEALKDNSWRVRMWAAWALGRIRDERGIDPLIKALRDDKLDVRRIAADALSNLGEPAIGPLVEAFDDEDPDFCARIEYVLWNIGNASIPPLIKALESDDSRVRMRSAIALGRINYKRIDDPPGVILDPSAIHYLETKIDSPVSKRDETQAVEPLIKALKDNEAMVRQYAACALGEIGDGRAAEPLMGMLNDNNEMMRKEAQEALKKIQKK
jgi:HEAT repeat protein